jgi:hypothetical protein
MSFDYLPLHNVHHVRRKFVSFGVLNSKCLASILWILLLIVAGEIYFYLFYILPLTPCESGIIKVTEERPNECLCNGENVSHIKVTLKTYLF